MRHGTGRVSNHPVPRPVRGRGYSRTNVTVNQGVNRKRPLIRTTSYGSGWVNNLQLVPHRVYGR